MAIDLSKSYEYFQPEKVDCRIHIVGVVLSARRLRSCWFARTHEHHLLWDMDSKSAQSGKSDFPSAGHWAL